MEKTAGIKFYEFSNYIPIWNNLTNLTILIQKIALAIFESRRSDEEKEQKPLSAYWNFIKTTDTVNCIIYILLPILSYAIVEDFEADSTPEKDIKPTTSFETPKSPSTITIDTFPITPSSTKTTTVETTAPAPIAGLNHMSNGGNTCYISSTLWALLHVDRALIEEKIRPFKEIEDEYQLAYQSYVEKKTKEEEDAKHFEEALFQFGYKGYVEEQEKIELKKQQETEAPTTTSPTPPKKISETDYINAIKEKDLKEKFQNHLKNRKPPIKTTITDTQFINSVANEEDKKKFENHLKNRKTPKGAALAVFVALFNAITSPEKSKEKVSGNLVNNFRSALKAYLKDKKLDLLQGSERAQEDSYEFQQALEELLEIPTFLSVHELHKCEKPWHKVDPHVDVMGIELPSPKKLQFNPEILKNNFIELPLNTLSTTDESLVKELETIENQKLSRLDTFKLQNEAYKKLKKGKQIKAREALKALYEKYPASFFSYEDPLCIALLEALCKAYPGITKLSSTADRLNAGLNHLCDAKLTFFTTQEETKMDIGNYSGKPICSEVERDGKEYKVERTYSLKNEAPYLCLQMKRYSHEEKVAIKNHCPLSIPQKFTINNAENKAVECSLHAIVVHKGSSTSGGHYYSILFKEGKAYKYDDMKGCKEISLEKAQKKYEKNCYMVYYKPEK